MSRAFVRESDQDAASAALPERPISAHPNLVTPEGLKQIEAQVRALEAQRQSAREANDSSELPRIVRDLRYWSARQATARVIEPLRSLQAIRFGARVTLRLADGTQRVFQIVGEDEADPARGLISWVSPLAESLLGKTCGDEIEFQGHAAEILALTG
jgi:transcription elongation GreA/GreB family factor